MVFLRYPGGKSKQLAFLFDYLPEAKDIKGKYIEPFVGGGSVFLHVKPDIAILGDLNKELIDLYKAIRNYPKDVWEAFESFPKGKKAYYKVRDTESRNELIHYRAARTLFLNRTCFKGMWRHNPQGNFNVGYGGEDRRWVITEENIRALSKCFKKAKIVFSDFETTLENCANGDFIFLDPPYKPGEKEMTHAHYINGKFTFTEQIRLAARLKEISKKKNIKWAMTNSSHPEVKKLYKDFEIKKIKIGTSNRPGIFANNAGEILITNY